LEDLAKFNPAWQAKQAMEARKLAVTSQQGQGERILILI